MSEKPLISIAMTTYNGERFLKEQMDSILNQTYSNFELVVCDDCSKDTTYSILKEYEKKDKRIKVFLNEKNLGFKKNFEKAISLCNGDYVALSDQDDIWLPEHLEKLISTIGNHEIACGNAELIDVNGTNKGYKLNESEDFYLYFDSDKLLYRLICSRNPFQGASMLMRKSFLNKAMPIPKVIPFHDTWFAFCSCFTDCIQYTFETINLYRQHIKQVTNHHKQSTFSKIESVISNKLKGKPFATDRFDYIDEIKKRYPITLQQQNIIDECFLILNMRARKLGIKERIKALRICWREYDYIYTIPGKKYRIIRLLKNLF